MPWTGTAASPPPAQRTVDLPIDGMPAQRRVVRERLVLPVDRDRDDEAPWQRLRCRHVRPQRRRCLDLDVVRRVPPPGELDRLRALVTPCQRPEVDPIRQAVRHTRGRRCGRSCLRAWQWARAGWRRRRHARRRCARRWRHLRAEIGDRPRHAVCQPPVRIERRRQLRADALRQLRLRIARHSEHEPGLRFVVPRDVLVRFRAAALQLVVRDVNRARHGGIAAAVRVMARDLPEPGSLDRTLRRAFEQSETLPVRGRAGRCGHRISGR